MKHNPPSVSLHLDRAIGAAGWCEWKAIGTYSTGVLLILTWRIGKSYKASVEFDSHLHTGKQPRRYTRCDRAFRQKPDDSVTTAEQRIVIKQLLFVTISLRGNCLVVGVGFQWPVQFMVERFQEAHEHPFVKLPSYTADDHASAGGRNERALQFCREGSSAIMLKPPAISFVTTVSPSEQSYLDSSSEFFTQDREIQ